MTTENKTNTETKLISSRTIEYFRAVAAASVELAANGLYSGINVAEKLVKDSATEQKSSSEEQL